MVNGCQVDVGNDSIGQTKRAKICACTVVITTLIVVAGTLGAITLVLRLQQGTGEASSVVSKEPLLSNNSPLEEEPIYDPPIKIDDGGLWLPKNPETPDLVAVDGQETVDLSSSPKPDTDGIDTDPEGNPVAENPVTPDLVAVDGQETVALSSSPKPDTDGIDIDPEGNPVVENTVTPDLVTPDLVAVDGQGTVALSSSPKPDTDGIDADPEGNPISQASSSSSDGGYSSAPDQSDPYQRNYISSSFPYDGFYMRGETGDPPPSHSEEPSSAEPSVGSGDIDLESSGEPQAVPSDSDNLSLSDFFSFS